MTQSRRNVAALIMVCAASTVHSQAQSPNRNPMSRVLQRWWAIGAHVVRLAEAMPEDKYRFKPFADVLSFADQVGHVADAHYSYCSRARNESNPLTVPIEGNISAKADLVAKLKESVAYCNTAYETGTDASLPEPWQQGANRGIKLGMLVGNIAHDNEHSSTMTMLMRMSGVSLAPLDSKD